MRTSEQLQRMQGHITEDVPTSGHPTRLWMATVQVVNPDGTVDCKPLQGGASKVAAPVPASYHPTVGDQVLMGDLNGDPRLPIVIYPFTGNLYVYHSQLADSDGAN